MEREGKAKLYRLVDESDWEELGIGYAMCSAVGDGTYEIVLEPLDADAEPWRQQIDENTEYLREEMIIQWQTDGGSHDGDDVEGCSYALSFETDVGCQGVLQQLERIQAELRNEERHEEMDDAFEMPEPTIGNLPAIEELLKSCQSHIQKHTVSAYFENHTFIDQVLDLLQPLEDVGDIDSIRTLFSVVKLIVSLNEAELMQILLQDHNYLKFFGLMEYNPDERVNPRHREFIEKKVRFVSVIPVDEALLKTIHYTFRLGYLRDIHPGVLDDPMVTRITHMVNANSVEIVRQLSKQENALEMMLEAIRNPEQATCTQVQAMTLLHEYTLAAAKNPFFNPPERMQYFVAMCTDNFFTTLRGVLQNCHDQTDSGSAQNGESGSSNSSSSSAGGGGTVERASREELEISRHAEARAIAARILVLVVKENQTACRKFILENDPMPAEVPPVTNRAQCEEFLRARTTEHPLLLSIIRFVTDCQAMGVQADGCEVLLALLNPENMSPGQKDKFLELFYNTYMRWLMLPFGNLSGTSDVQLATEPYPAKNAKGLICELLSYCVEKHGFRIKYFTIKNNTLAQCIQLCRYPNKALRLAGIRFLLECCRVKDTFYPRFIVKNDLFKLVFEVLKENGDKNTMTRSTIAALVKHVAEVPVKPLVIYIVDKYSAELTSLPSEELVKVLHMKREQFKDNPRGRPNGTIGGDKTTDAMDAHVSKQQKRYRETLNEESYFDEDDDTDGSNGTGDGGGGGGGSARVMQLPLDSLEMWKDKNAGPSGNGNGTRGLSGGAAGAGSMSALREYGAEEEDDDDENRGNAASSVKKARLDKS